MTKYRQSAEKGEIYECGEKPVVTAWIQFDLRFYVVALLFVIFDVEVAFFFPWAVVFGKANALASDRLPDGQRAALTRELVPGQAPSASEQIQPEAAHHLAWFAFWDIIVF